MIDARSMIDVRSMIDARTKIDVRPMIDAKCTKRHQGFNESLINLKRQIISL